MYAIDLAYYDYEASLTHERQDVNFASDFVNVGLTSAVPLVSAVATKNILGSAASALTGIRSSYNDDILFNRTVQVLQSQMRANRAIVAAQILANLHQSTSDYPLASALSQLEDYYRAGTISGALLEVNATVAKQVTVAEGQKEAVLAAPLAEPPTAPLTGGTPLRRINRPSALTEPSFVKILATYDPATDSIAYVTDKLKRLCIPPSEVMPVAPAAVARIMVYQQMLRDNLGGDPSTTVDGRLTRRQLQLIGSTLQSCPPGLANAFEAETYRSGINDPSLIELLNRKLDVKVPQGASADTVRIAIARARTILRPELELNLPDLANQATFDLVRALAR